MAPRCWTSTCAHGRIYLFPGCPPASGDKWPYSLKPTLKTVPAGFPAKPLFPGPGCPSCPGYWLGPPCMGAIASSIGL